MITKIRMSNGSVGFMLCGWHNFGTRDDLYCIGKQNGRYWVHRPFERSFYCSKSLCMTYRRKVVVQGGIIDL